MLRPTFADFVVGRETLAVIGLGYVGLPLAALFARKFKVIAEKTAKLLIANDRPVKGAKVLILGWTFKEDVPDIRNTRVIDIHRELQSYGVAVSCYDPEADPAEVRHEYDIELLAEAPQQGPFDAIILAVKHRALLAAYPEEKLQALGGAHPPVLIDVKGFRPTGSAAPAATAWQL